MTRLFGPTSERDELARFYAVTGTVDAFALPSLAWEVSYRLAEELADVAVEVIPDLPSSLNAPPPALLPELEAAAAPLAHDWALSSVRAQRAWGVPPPTGGAARGAGIRIGHPDTGYVLHPEYEIEAIDLALDADVIAGDDDATDPLEELPGYQPGHGTRTGSVIASRSSGVLTGVAPASTLVPIRTVKSVAQFFDGDVAKAVNHARATGCGVVSMSLGGLGFRGLEAAIDRAVGDGVIVAAAAGNYLRALRYMVVWPARYRNCIAVGAVNADDRPWPHSSRGSKVAISAPGEGVWVPDLSQRRSPAVTQSSGTSYGVAHVAGAAALWLAHHGRDRLVARYGARNVQAAFVTVLRATARRPQGWDAALGAGVLDAEALLKAKLPPVAELAAAESARPEIAEDESEAVFSELAAIAPVEGVAELLPDDPADPRRATLRRELLYLVTESRELRSEIATRESVGLEATPTRLSDVILPHASPTLAAHMSARSRAQSGRQPGADSSDPP